MKYSANPEWFSWHFFLRLAMTTCVGVCYRSHDDRAVVPRGRLRNVTPAKPTKVADPFRSSTSDISQAFCVICLAALNSGVLEDVGQRADVRCRYQATYFIKNVFSILRLFKKALQHHWRRETRCSWHHQIMVVTVKLTATEQGDSQHVEGS